MKSRDDLQVEWEWELQIECGSGNQTYGKLKAEEKQTLARQLLRLNDLERREWEASQSRVIVEVPPRFSGQFLCPLNQEVRAHKFVIDWTHPNLLDAVAQFFRSHPNYKGCQINTPTTKSLNAWLKALSIFRKQQKGSSNIRCAVEVGIGSSTSAIQRVSEAVHETKVRINDRLGLLTTLAYELLSPTQRHALTKEIERCDRVMASEFLSEDGRALPVSRRHPDPRKDPVVRMWQGAKRRRLDAEIAAKRQFMKAVVKRDPNLHKMIFHTVPVKTI